VATGAPACNVLHGQAGHGKTTCGRADPEILHRLAMCSKGILVTATTRRSVGQYIGHTAPKTREILKRAMGGVLVIDEPITSTARRMTREYCAKNDRDPPQVMEKTATICGDLRWLQKTGWMSFISQPGLSSRWANTSTSRLQRSGAAGDAKLIMAAESYSLQAPRPVRPSPITSNGGMQRLSSPNGPPRFRNAIDRARMRQAKPACSTTAAVA